MSKQSDSPRERLEPTPPSSGALFVLGTIGDTTWRMFVPTLTCLVLGDLADKQFGIKPWGLVIGVIVGFTLAIMLIIHQLKQQS